MARVTATISSQICIGPAADHLDFRLGASGETLTIYDTDRTTVIDRVTLGSQTEDPNQTQITNVVISEVLTHTDPPLEDAIELQNLTGVTVDISHWWLSDSASEPRKYRIPAGTTIAPYGFKVFYQYQFGVGPTGFSLNSAEGDDVYSRTRIPMECPMSGRTRMAKPEFFG